MKASHRLLRFALSASFVFTISLYSSAHATELLTPDTRLTPGALCTTPDEYRYPAQIAYCRRILPNSVKEEVIETYNQQYGLGIRLENRRCYKVDHFIPLCLGGSNEKTNLWPQHLKAGKITDPLEPLVCQKLAENKITHVDAIRFIHEAKLNLSRVDAIYAQVDALQRDVALPPVNTSRVPAQPRPIPRYEPNTGAGPDDLNDCLK